MVLKKVFLALPPGGGSQGSRWGVGSFRSRQVIREAVQTLSGDEEKIKIKKLEGGIGEMK